MAGILNSRPRSKHHQEESKKNEVNESRRRGTSLRAFEVVFRTLEYPEKCTPILTLSNLAPSKKFIFSSAVIHDQT